MTPQDEKIVALAKEHENWTLTGGREVVRTEHKFTDVLERPFHAFKIFYRNPKVSESSVYQFGFWVDTDTPLL